MTRRTMTVTTDQPRPRWHPSRRSSGTALAAVALAVLLGGVLLGGCARASVPMPGTPTVAYFYAVGCASCAQALHDIGATRPAAPPGTVYQAVDINPAGSPSDIRGFLADARTDGFALLRDPGNRLAATYRVTALGTTVVFDAAGRQVWRGIDPSTATLAAALTKTTAAR